MHVGLSSPGPVPVISSCWGRTHYTLRGGGRGETGRKNIYRFHKFRTISTKPLVKEMTVEIVMTKKKVIILKVILKVVTNIKVIMKAMKVTVVTVVTRMVVTVMVAINPILERGSTVLLLLLLLLLLRHAQATPPHCVLRVLPVVLPIN